MRHLESRHLVTERDRFLDERHLHMDVHAPPPRAEMGVARAFAAQLGEALPLLSVAGFGALLVWVAFATGMHCEGASGPLHEAVLWLGRLRHGDAL